MKYTILPLLLLIACFSIVAHAQENAKIKFNETTHDFGNLQKGDPAEFNFVFTNISDGEVQLSNVKASCGCTTPSWTREVVKPGERGEIMVKYNSNRVGPFTKSITITYDEEEKPVVVYIKGKVEAPAAPTIAYKNVIGGLAFDKVSANVGTMDSDKDQRLVFNLKNISPHKIDFTDKFDVGSMFHVELDRMSLTPGQTAKVTVNVIGKEFAEGGDFNETIKLYTQESDEAEKVITISGNIHRVLSAEEKAQLPSIQFKSLSYDGGKVLEGEKVRYAYEFVNTGVNDLVIESVKASCGCTATAPKDKVIKGGQSSEIVATFDSRGRKGRQSKTITVKTNDPDQPTIVLRLSVEVESDPFHVNDLGPAAKPAGSGLFNN